jgi:Holliday junction resolvase RusA-like endonuclease
VLSISNLSVMAERAEDRCKRCDKVVGGFEESILCDFCGIWFHRECVGLTGELYQLMQAYEGKNGDGLFWCCGSCKGDCKRLCKEVSDLRGEVLKTQKEVSQCKKEVETVKKESGKGMKEDIAKIKELVDKIKKEDGEFKSEVRRDLDQLRKEGREVKREEVEVVRKELEELKVVSSEQGLKKTFASLFEEQSKEEKKEARCEREVVNNKDLKMQVTEAIDRERRRNNLMVFGLPEGTDEEDLEQMTDIISCVVQGTKVDFVTAGRLGKKCEKCRPLRITIEDFNERRLVLVNAKRLKSMSGKEQIFIAPDMTKLQQDVDRNLREEVKRRRLAGEVNVKIVKGKVIWDRRIANEVRHDVREEVPLGSMVGLYEGVHTDDEVVVKVGPSAVRGIMVRCTGEEVISSVKPGDRIDRVDRAAAVEGATGGVEAIMKSDGKKDGRVLGKGDARKN